MKRSIPRFLSFRRPKRRILNASVSAPLMFEALDLCVGNNNIPKEIEILRGDLSCCTSEGPAPGPQSPNSITVENYVIAELLNTERTYVAELESIVEHYVERFEASEHQPHIAAQIRGRPDLVFGNIRDLLLFHSRCLLPELDASENSPSAICRCFLQHQHRFLALYFAYCQNKSPSEAIRKEFADSTPFFTECQRRAGHPLPLGAYLLKPVQRITKYQLLLKELERHCRPEVRVDVEAALHCMLDLLTQINSAIQQLHIIGFSGDLRLMGPLRLQTECDVYAFSKKKSRRGSRAQRRHLFLFDGGLLLCKRRGQQTAADPDYYEYKASIPTGSLSYCDQNKCSPHRFDVWDDSKNEGWAVEPVEAVARARWADCLGRLAAAREEGGRQRPRSWTSTLSTDSSCSASTRTSSDHSNDSVMDTNGNSTPGTSFPCLLDSPTLSCGQETDQSQVLLPTTAPFVPTIEESHSPEETVNC